MYKLANICGNYGFLRMMCRGQATKSACNRLTGKVAVVTGSTDGIGLAIAKRLAMEGAKVVINSFKQELIDKTVKELQQQKLDVVGIKCDISKDKDRKDLFAKTMETCCKLDILVSNAATIATTTVMDCEEAVWDKLFDLNVKAQFMLAKEALPFLCQEKDSNIVFISSIAGYEPFPEIGAYSVTKTAMIGLTVEIAKELGPMGIRVNGLAPGVIKTQFSTMLYEKEEDNRAVIEKTLLGRLGLPEDMAGVVAFLVSDDARYVTGATVVASGGYGVNL